MTDLPVPLLNFRLGDLLGQSLRVVGRHPFGILGVNLLPSLPALIVMAMTNDLPEQSAVADLLTAPVSFVFFCLAQAMTIHGTQQILQGEAFVLRDALRAALPRLLPTIGASLLSAVLILTGFAALFIPGLIAICFLYVTLPACLVETKGAVESLERSGELTRGYRWTIFGVFALTTVPAFLASAALGDLGDTGASSLVSGLADEVVSALCIAFNAVCSTVCFVELRRIRESASMVRIAPIFD